MEDIRYPIGKFKELSNPSFEVIQAWIKSIEENPSLLRNALRNLNTTEYDIPFRSGGWTVKQIVHHIADNNINILFRIKRTLTEEQPRLPSFREDRWAELADYKEPIEPSLNLIDIIYTKLLIILKDLKYEDYSRTMYSDTFGILTLSTIVQRFLWHDSHHIGQIKSMTSKNV